MDVITLAGVVVLLGALVWAGILIGGEQRRIWVCTHRIKTLGRAFAEYARDHQGALPPAVVDDGQKKISWDWEIAAYLNPGFAKQNPPGNEKELKAKVAFAFKCPSDKEPRGGAVARSYSMPIYDINLDGWPPDQNSLGGVGLILNAKRLEKARKAMPLQPSDYVPAIKVSMVPAPADTALLVECINIQNALWGTEYACIASTTEQFGAKTIEAKDYHRGKMNYLMLDGHVELLSPAQDDGYLGLGTQGLLTIKRGD